MKDYYNKYIKYKMKYMNLKNMNIQIGGVNNIFTNNEKKLLNKLLKKIPIKILELKDKTNLIMFINNILNRTYTEKDFINIVDIQNIIKLISIDKIIIIDQSEGFNIIKIKEPHIIKKDIDDYINEKKLELSYSIYHNNRNINNDNEHIYPMHSIGKVFTGFLIMLLLKDNIITEKDIFEPIKLDKQIINKLSPNVIKRLQETTMLDVMIHKSGLKNYLTKYFAELRKDNKINPIEPDDYIDYIDDEVMDQGNFYYSNAGILLCGLSIKYLYNKKFNTSKTYNEILYEYIITPAKLTTFSITKPKHAIYNKETDIIEFVNGSPGGGYWISSNDLAKFGVFMLDKINENSKIIEYLKKYGQEFYHNNIIMHDGGLPGSNCWLMVYIQYNISIAIMDNDGKSSRQLKFAIEYIGK